MDTKCIVQYNYIQIVAFCNVRTIKGVEIKMNESNVVYCLECNSLILRKEAHIIFKTGFYKTNIPLSHCKNCTCLEATEMDIRILMNSKKIQFDSNYIGDSSYIFN
ncbi:putative nucleic acid-binding Zn ribbon protein [Paenibacillus qinlingensis]|uniref:Nucleic acid-binding Zn ribbon protein n=1 Tax=Paenibacillus qinlingensis TaxID=1837343 RepID=A0ABU1P471_9BACL|nr:putative nucleic acid-binding Zn ribbon protein [Paenibacillus qinlingensis]